MNVVFRDVLKADLVLVGFGLLTQANELETFRAAVNTDVVVSGQSMTVDAQTNVAETGRIFNLNRDRIVLDLSRIRSTIRRDYPEEIDLVRLAQVAALAVEASTQTGQTLRAYGYNLDLVYEQTTDSTAQEYLAKRLFSTDLPFREQWQLVGGACRVVFREGENQWQFSVEPRFNDPNIRQVFLSLNLHKEKQTIPSEDEIKNSLQEAWAKAREFAVALDAKGE
jgi:hypothetical protein